MVFLPEDQNREAMNNNHIKQGYDYSSSIQLYYFHFKTSQWWMLGRGPGGPLLIFKPNWRPKGRKKIFGDHPPLSQDLDDVVFFISLLVYLFVYFSFVCLTSRRQRSWPECRPSKKAERWIWNIAKKMWQFAPKYIIYNWSIDWLTDWQTDWMIVWLITYLFPFVKRKMGEWMDTNKEWRRRGQKF